MSWWCVLFLTCMASLINCLSNRLLMVHPLRTYAKIRYSQLPSFAEQLIIVLLHKPHSKISQQPSSRGGINCAKDELSCIDTYPKWQELASIVVFVTDQSWRLLGQAPFHIQCCYTSECKRWSWAYSEDGRNDSWEKKMLGLWERVCVCTHGMWYSIRFKQDDHWDWMCLYAAAAEIDPEW